MVAGGPAPIPQRQDAGDQPGQRAGEPQPADPVPQADRGLRPEVRAGGAVGVLPAVSQQIQPDRALLGHPGDALERVAAGFGRGGGGVRQFDDLEGQASRSPCGGDDLQQGSEAEAEGDEGVGVRGRPIGRPGKMVRGDPSWEEFDSGWLITLKPLTDAPPPGRRGTLYWNCREFREGRRRRHSPYELVGLRLPSYRFWDLLGMPIPAAGTIGSDLRLLNRVSPLYLWLY